MTIAIGDLLVRYRSDTSDLQRGAQEGTRALQSVEQQARATGEQLDQLARKFAQAQGGTAAQWRDILERSNVSSASAARQIGDSAERTSSAIQKLAEPHRIAAQATQTMSEGWQASETSALRFAAGVAGVGLGLSLVTGLASKLHEAIAGVVTSQLSWEQSLKSISGAYGDLEPRIANVAQQQARLPNVLGTQGEFAQAALNATDLRLRYGISEGTVTDLTTTGGRIAYATGLTAAGDRAKLQQQILDAVRTGASLPAQYGVFTDDEAVARRLGGAGAQSLGTYTPQQLMEARAAIVSEGGTQFADRAEANRRAALDASAAAEKALEQAQGNVQTSLEGSGRSTIAYGRTAVRVQPGGVFAPRQSNDQASALQTYLDNQDQLVAATQLQAEASANSARVQEDARKTFDDLAHSAERAGQQLLSFTGSLEDNTSIGHGDLLAQAQSSVAGRARSAVPVAGMSNLEIGQIATATAWQQAWQNFTAQLAQEQNANPIRTNLERLANQAGPGLEGSRAAASRALAQGPQLDAIDRSTGQAQRAQQLVDLQTAQTQSRLEQITLTQRERSVELLRQTVDLRKLDVQQQQAGVAASMSVIRAQQSAQPAFNALSDAQFQVNQASVLADARMARVLQGKDVSVLPSIDQLIHESQAGQLAAAEAGPAALTASRGIELAGRGATATGLAQQLTEGNLRYQELGVDLKNLGDLPQQTALMLEDIQNGRDSLSVQQQLRDGVFKLIEIMSGGPSSSGGGGNAVDAITNRVAAQLFGDDGSSRGNLPDRALPGARRGPF